MSHLDYACCAICDDELRYVYPDTETKRVICDECREATGIPDTAELIRRLRYEPEAAILAITPRYKKCEFDNVVDRRVWKAVQIVARPEIDHL